MAEQSPHAPQTILGPDWLRLHADPGHGRPAHRARAARATAGRHRRASTPPSSRSNCPTCRPPRSSWSRQDATPPPPSASPPCARSAWTPMRSWPSCTPTTSSRTKPRSRRRCVAPPASHNRAISSPSASSRPARTRATATSSAARSFPRNPPRAPSRPTPCSASWRNRAWKWPRNLSPAAPLLERRHLRGPRGQATRRV